MGFLGFLNLNVAGNPMPIPTSASPLDDELQESLTAQATAVLLALCPEIASRNAQRRDSVKTVIVEAVPAAIAQIRADRDIADCLGAAAFQYAVLSLVRDGLKSLGRFSVPRPGSSPPSGTRPGPASPPAELSALAAAARTTGPTPPPPSWLCTVGPLRSDAA